MAKPIIGSIEQVQIVSHGDELVLAKIDTGAESSSIWATQVSQDSGVLHYVLFGPGSVYYSGKVRTSKRFKVTTVKSSFGHSETRYKVLLEIKIGKHRIKGWFTLADRSRNTYPILLGKSLLKDQFLVDVSMNHVHSDGSLEKKVLVISSSPETAGFLKNVQKVSANHINYDVLDFEHILFDINGDMSDVINSTNGESLAEYALTYVKSHWKYPEPASALAEYLKFKNRSLVDEELFHYTSRSKLSEMMNLAVHGLPVPRSYVGYKTALVDQADSIIKSLGFPLVMKNVTSDKGKDNFFIEDEKVYYAILENAAGMDIYAVQEYIPNDGFYRLNIFGKDVMLAVYRKAHPHKDPLKQHLNKPSGGKNASLIAVDSLQAGVLEIAVRAAICMDRQIAGADMVQDSNTGQWYILEVNSSPQLRSGSYPDEKTQAFAAFIERRLEK